ncbi:hypothetical protein MLD38_005344 [Melastoma candidum]|uniref:Uncharacterized protein n=1 Tax=Melastoma candidum TaxID=119954 RepID=A0ACB9SH47_9MYRT|nr:hypothetical protein MLD38_005344 [Melastoma candidum]
MIPSRTLVTMALVVWFLSLKVQSLRFDLRSGQTKCISEDMRSNAMTVGKFSVINPSDILPLDDSHRISLRVTSPRGNSYHTFELVTTGQFAFTAIEAGDYMVCFSVPNHDPVISMSVDFDWKTGVAAKDWSSIAKKDQLYYMEIELNKLNDTIHHIHQEMFYLREREEEMQDLNKATNSKMAWLSFLSLCICLSVVGLQLWHLKTFFEKKKLI